jgi:hypothetical protein
MAREQHGTSCFYHGCGHVHVLQSLMLAGGEAIPPWIRMALQSVKKLPQNIHEEKEHTIQAMEACKLNRPNWTENPLLTGNTVRALAPRTPTAGALDPITRLADCGGPPCDGVTIASTTCTSKVVSLHVQRT